MSVLRALGAICNLYYIYFTLDNQTNVYVVLFGSTVIFAAVVSYDVFIFHDVIIVFVYNLICLHRGTQGRIAITAKCATLFKHCISKI